MNSKTAADKIGSITGSALFRRVVITLIVINAIIVGLDTYPQIHAAYGQFLWLADRIILYVFALELVLRFLASSPHLGIFPQRLEPLRFDNRERFFSALIAIFHCCAPVSDPQGTAHGQRDA